LGVSYAVCSLSPTLQKLKSNGEKITVYQKHELRLLSSSFGLNATSKELDESSEILSNEPIVPYRFCKEQSEMLKLFVNQSLLRKIESYAPQAEYCDTQEIYKYGFSSASVSSEFRTVSTVFIKLEDIFNPVTAQKAMMGFNKILRKWEGVFQQYSVDDKGQCLLACFGLPPWTHDKEAFHALKAAVEFSEFAALETSIGPVSISVATGDLLYGKIGNHKRSDASLLGKCIHGWVRRLLPNMSLRTITR
jgi:hypothetical protein